MTPKELNAKLEAAAAALQGVERKRMPGGYALFTAGKIFANVTLDGRVGLKLPVAWCFEELAALPGAGPWKLGQRLMEGWVLIPESFHTNDATLIEWVTRAHACAQGKMPAKRPEPAPEPEPEPEPESESQSQSIEEEDSPPTARSRHADPSSRSIIPQPRNGSSALIIDDDGMPQTPPLPKVARPPRSSKSLVAAPPSSRDNYDFSSYAPPPPSSLGIRVVPKDPKSPFEETLIGVPAPSSSSQELEQREQQKKAAEKKAGE